MSTYSFLDVTCTINGPGGNFNLAMGAGAAEEGISFAPVEDINTMTIGAGGDVMHSLHANQSEVATIRLLKTSPVNQQLAQMYNLQTSNGALHGQNVIILNNPRTGDNITCRAVAFKKKPDLTYAKEGGINEWTLDCGIVNRSLGANY